MYCQYFGLEDRPFSIAADPRYLYMSERHREALGHLLYGISGEGGIVLLTGEVGTGKTTVCRCLLEQVPKSADVAFVVNPKVTVTELLSTICDELGIQYPVRNRSVKVFVDQLNGHLLRTHAAGRDTVLIIDEAQNLSTDVLEQLRLLTNLETTRRKLLQIVLLGQPELLNLLRRPELRQLEQRVIARYHLTPLSLQDVLPYVSHRLAVAGAQTQFFPASLARSLFKLSGGIPRLINMICDRALLGTYVREKHIVNRKILTKAAREVLGRSRASATYPEAPAGRVALLVRGSTERFSRATKLRSAAAGVALTALGFAAAVVHNSSPLQDLVAKPQQARLETGKLAAISNQPESVVVESIENAVPSAESAQATTQSARELTETPNKSALLATLSWPEGQPIARSRTMAFEALFELWGIEYQSQRHGAPCEFAKSEGLRCRPDAGSLKDVRGLNRPVVLTLLNEEEGTFQATLAQFRKQTATVIVGEEARKLSVDELESRWSGHYTLLWRPAPADAMLIGPGSSGPAVQWLANQLAMIRGQPQALGGKLEFDDTLLVQVKQFQRDTGLAPDGVVGHKTLIQLNTAVGEGIPLLNDARGG